MEARPGRTIYRRQLVQNQDVGVQRHRLGNLDQLPVATEKWRTGRSGGMEDRPSSSSSRTVCPTGLRAILRKGVGACPYQD